MPWCLRKKSPEIRLCEITDSLYLSKMAMEKGTYTRRFGLSGAKSTFLVIERLTGRNNAVDVTFYDAINAFVCDKNSDEQHGIGLVPMLGIGFHSFIDGVIYSITFTVSIFTGLLAATGMVLHEFPEGIITYLLLIKGGFSEKISLLLAFLAAALTTPLGMLVSYPYISKIDEPLLGALLAFSAGALVYVGATHLLPQAEAEHKKYSLFALGAGILVAVVIVLSKA